MRSLLTTVLLSTLLIAPAFADNQTAQDAQEAKTDCSSSLWCSGYWDQCVNGECVPSDAFHYCHSNFDCMFPDQCVDGSCKSN